ncbi:MAG TPA: hypothetical protein PLJ21_12350, partial [Pseudobdellovibrionaceae bacterium]|nr:hypothetical protein [Pseudobdellovibrionaceae bacterium]
VKSNGQPYYSQSSFQTCQLDSGGTPQYTSHSCCEVSYAACIDQKVELDFFPRLIYRKNSCCIEGCPSANYWIDGLVRNPNMPQSKEVKKLTYQHTLYNSSLPSQCIKAVIGSCPYQACQSNQYCPQPPTSPSPSPSPNPNPQPGPSPSPQPRPSPSPSPQPRPSPSPSPQPRPSPPVSGGDT